MALPLYRKENQNVVVTNVLVASYTPFVIFEISNGDIFPVISYNALPAQHLYHGLKKLFTINDLSVEDPHGNGSTMFLCVSLEESFFICKMYMIDQSHHKSSQKHFKR